MDYSPPGSSVHGFCNFLRPSPSPEDLPDPGIKPMSHVSCPGRQVLYHNSFVVVVQSLSCVWLFATPWTAVLHHLLKLAQTHVHWVSDAIQPFHPLSVVPFSSCLQSFPASASFLMSQLFASGGQSTGASASVLPMNIQDWFPLGLTGLISLQFKGLSRAFSNTKGQKE